MEITKMLTISSGHLTTGTLNMLDVDAAGNNFPFLGIFPKSEFGYFVYIDESAFQQTTDTVPSDLRDVIGFTLRSGCSLLCLDCDGYVIPSLPHYDDDENISTNCATINEQCGTMNQQHQLSPEAAQIALAREQYRMRLLKAAKDTNWRYEEKDGYIILTHIALPDPLVRIVASPDNILGDVRKYASEFNRDEYFGVRYQQELEETARIPNAQSLLDEAKSAQFALRGLVSTLEWVPTDDSKKKMDFQVGVTLSLSFEEFRKIADLAKEGPYLIRDKLFSGAFRLSGKCYSDNNAEIHGPDEWKHDEISYQF